MSQQVLGSVLCYRESLSKWLSILESRIWDIQNGQERILWALKLSFDDLESPYLKQCFVYCSMFRKGFLIERENLIQLWMAEGLLHHHYDESNLEMEDIGNQYFDILLKRALFQDASRDDYDIINNCRMHYLVHDLAEAVFNDKSKSYGIRQGAWICTSTLQSIPKRSLMELRSLFTNDKVTTSIIQDLKHLRVLNLYEADIEEFPISIWELIHFRYLDISKTNIKILPGSIGYLYNLQTLRMYKTKYLEKIPKEVKQLINLRHLCFDKKMGFPAGMRQLIHLRTLPYFTVGMEMGPGIQELVDMNQLKGELVIYNLEHVKDGNAARKANLLAKGNLCKLRFVWKKGRSAGNNNEEDVLEGLQPPTNLEDLTIENFMGDKFPSWMLSRLYLELINLKTIRLGNCNQCEGVPALGLLPKLKHLEIDGMANLNCVGVEFYGYKDDNDATATNKKTMALFPALQKLSILRCKNLIEWMEAPVMSTEEVAVFPCLEELYIWFCPKLRNAPSHFPSLKRLDINHVHGLTSLPEGMLKKNKSLTYLKVSDCRMLTHIAPDVFGCCASLQSLVIDGCERLKHLPDGLDTLFLEELTIRHCSSLEIIPITRGIASLHILRIEFCDRLSGILYGLEYCANLQELVICGCRNLTSIPTRGVALTSLRICVISGCPQLSRLPSELQQCTSLQELEISYCSSLASTQFARGVALTSLRICIISGCSRLSSLPSGLEYCTSLWELEISFCPRLTSILFAQDLPSLHHLEIRDCDELSSLPALECCPSLQKLSIRNCAKLTSFSISFKPNRERASTSTTNLLQSRAGEKIFASTSLSSLEKLSIDDCSSPSCLTRLKDLRIGGFCEELDSFPRFQVGSKLETLWLLGWPKLKFLPEEIQHFTSLTSLWIGYFNGVEAVPECLGNLSSLESLSIESCENLMYLPTVEAMQQLTKLQELVIVGCPLLEKRCTVESGPEWPKISHIPSFRVFS